MNKTYINNLETGKIELHFEKSEYIALSEDQKKEIKRNFLFSKYANAWVSRSKNNHYSALNVAKKLGFTVEEVKGKKLSYEEELNNKIEKAERRAERYDEYASNSIEKAKILQSEFNSFRGDIAFMTQPNVQTSSGRSFTNRRNRIMDRYNKGFEEYRKSSYFVDKAETARNTAEAKQLKDKVYLSNRIKECKKAIKQYESYIVSAEEKFFNGEEEAEQRIEKYLSELEYYIEKEAFMQNCLDSLGGVCTSADINEGYHIKARHGWMKVKKVNRTTVLAEHIEHPLKGMISKVEYSEIKEIKIPEGYQEKKADTITNPYNLGDILIQKSYAGNHIIYAYQVIKKTEKSIKLQKINLDDNREPIKDGFTLDKPFLKKIVKSNYSDYVGVLVDDRQVSIF